jgi:hypothetical protein
MKVRDFLLKIAEYNQDLDVVVSNEDDDVLEITGFSYVVHRGQLRIIINQ